MKNIKLFILAAFNLITCSLFAQNPTYLLECTNQWPDAFSVMNEIEWDVDLTWTNPDVAPEFEYAGGQYFFDIPSSFAAGGTLTMISVGSDLPIGMQPRNPTVYTSTNPWQLRWAVNVFPGAGNGYNFPAYSPITILRIRLETSASMFSGSGLAWRNAPSIPSTKIFAYVGSTNTEVTTPSTHLINLQILYPVELVYFSAVSDRNNVTLNWTTVEEINNQGFDVERSVAGSSAWVKVGFVPGNGTSTESETYSFKDIVTAGKFNYRLKQIDFNGNFEYFDLPEAVTIGVPDKFFVDQNYPNPFNPLTTIAYGTPQSGNVTLKIFDMTGREIKTLVNEYKDADYYVAKFDGSSLASGTYIYRIESGTFVSAKKMVLLK